MLAMKHGVFDCVGVRQCASSLTRLQMYLRELLRLMLPRFHQHLTRLGEDGLQLLFCHRWILLCFKREFPDTEALRMWEACWAHYQVRGQSPQRGMYERTDWILFHSGTKCGSPCYSFKSCHHR